MNLINRMLYDKKRNYNRPLKVAIFGGAFDPITEGHFRMINLVLNELIIDYVWLLPCNEHLFRKHMVNSYHRINMLELAMKDYTRVSVIDYEIEKKLTGSTYEFFHKLLFEPDIEMYDFSMLVGLDNAQEYKKWHNFDELIKIVKFITVSRPGIERDPKIDWYTKSPHIFIKSNKLMDCSSTIVRNILFSDRNYDALKLLMHPLVLQYIKRYNLYSM